jgi:hypothetical protein
MGSFNFRISSLKEVEFFTLNVSGHLKR